MHDGGDYPEVVTCQQMSAKFIWDWCTRCLLLKYDGACQSLCFVSTDHSQLYLLLCHTGPILKQALLMLSVCVESFLILASKYCMNCLHSGSSKGLIAHCLDQVHRSAHTHCETLYGWIYGGYILWVHV